MSLPRPAVLALLSAALLLGGPSALWAQGRQQPSGRAPAPRSQPSAPRVEPRNDRGREREARPDRSQPPVRSTGEPELRRRRP